jgi:SHS2 domain-containing protein
MTSRSDVKWLSEILYLFEGEDLITTEIAVNQMSESSINSTLITVGFDARYHEVLREIKAITYHQVEVREDEGSGQPGLFLIYRCQHEDKTRKD